MKGFRQQPESSRKERLRALEAELKNSQMSLRISQMVTQQMMQNLKNISEDLGKAFGLINELQYKILAMQKVSSFDLTELNNTANELRLKDFNEASDKEDAEKGFTVVNTVANNSTVILTSKTDNPDGGIFRSRIELATCGVPDLISSLLGREVGAKAIIKLNEVEHEVELLGIRQPAEALAAVATTAETQLSEPAATPSTEVAGNA